MFFGYRNEKNNISIKSHKNGKKPVLEILKPIILACNIFGIQSFVINNNIIKAPKFNIFKTSYGFLITSIIVYSAIYVSLYNNKIGLQYYNDLAEYLSNMCIFIMGNICLCICRNKFIKSMEQIIRVEKTLSNLGLVQPYKKHQVLIILQLIILFIICILRFLTDVQLHFTDTNITIFKFICNVISLITHILILVLFSNIILILNSKFKILNGILKCYTKKTKYNTSRACLVNVIPPLSKPYPHVSFKLYILQKIKMLHYELCNITRQLNYIFNIPLLLSSGILFVSFTGDIYLLYRETFFYDRINYILLLIISSIKLSLIILPCSIIKNEVSLHLN